VSDEGVGMKTTGWLLASVAVIAVLAIALLHRAGGERETLSGASAPPVGVGDEDSAPKALTGLPTSRAQASSPRWTGTVIAWPEASREGPLDGRILLSVGGGAEGDQVLEAEIREGRFDFDFRDLQPIHGRTATWRVSVDGRPWQAWSPQPQQPVDSRRSEGIVLYASEQQVVRVTDQASGLDVRDLVAYAWTQPERFDTERVALAAPIAPAPGPPGGQVRVESLRLSSPFLASEWVGDSSWRVATQDHALAVVPSNPDTLWAPYTVALAQGADLAVEVEFVGAPAQPGDSVLLEGTPTGGGEAVFSARWLAHDHPHEAAWTIKHLPLGDYRIDASWYRGGRVLARAATEGTRVALGATESARFSLRHGSETASLGGYLLVADPEWREAVEEIVLTSIPAPRDQELVGNTWTFNSSRRPERLRLARGQELRAIEDGFEWDLVRFPAGTCRWDVGPLGVVFLAELTRGDDFVVLEIPARDELEIRIVDEAGLPISGIRQASFVHVLPALGHELPSPLPLGATRSIEPSSVLRIEVPRAGVTLCTIAMADGSPARTRAFDLAHGMQQDWFIETLRPLQVVFASSSGINFVHLQQAMLEDVRGQRSKVPYIAFGAPALASLGGSPMPAGRAGHAESSTATFWIPARDVVALILVDPEGKGERRVLVDAEQDVLHMDG
jgi:hypothetical protein